MLLLCQAGIVRESADDDAAVAPAGLDEGCEEMVKAAREVALEAADRFAVGLALGLFAGQVGLGLGVVSCASDGDDVQGVVELAVAAAVQPVASSLTRMSTG